jgi:hypothetical protein
VEAGGGERRRYIPGASRRRAGQVSGPHLAAGGAGREALPRRRGGRGPAPSGAEAACRATTGVGRGGQAQASRG